jgi:hypothetical protein
VLEIALNLSLDQLSGEIPAEFASFEFEPSSLRQPRDLGSLSQVTRLTTSSPGTSDTSPESDAERGVAEASKPKGKGRCGLGLGFLKSARGAVASNFEFRMNESDDLWGYRF